jgi:uncharacterized membrane protein
MADNGNPLDPKEADGTEGRSGMHRLRNYFLTGVIVAAPLFLTVYITWSFIQWIDSWVKPFIPAVYNPDNYLPFVVPGFGLVVALVFLTLLGFLTANLVGRTLISYGENILGRLPFVRGLYRGLKQIFDTVLSKRQKSFQSVGLIEFPREGIWSLVFIATTTSGEVAARIGPDGEEILTVFLPPTPNPTGGFVMFVKARDVVRLDMTVEEGAKLVISAGLVAPEYRAKTAELAARALLERAPEITQP